MQTNDYDYITICIWLLLLENSVINIRWKYLKTYNCKLFVLDGTISYHMDDKEEKLGIF